VGGASHGNMFLLLFGLGLSIPFIVFTSNLLSTLMDKYPVIIYLGAAVLGKVGGEMMITDPAIDSWVEHNAAWLETWRVAAIIGAALVLAIGLWLAKRKAKAHDSSGSATVEPGQPNS